MTWLSSAPWFVQSPWMLLALLSTIIPLFIHLFSKSKGKLIPFGNIKLIQLSKPVKMNEIRLVKRLLLLCRLLLLFLSVLLLAQVYYDDRASSNANIEGNILVTKDWLNNANDEELNTLALKAKLGIVFLLSKRSKRLTGDVILTWSSSQYKNQTLARYTKQNTWLLVKNYANSLPNNAKITVYSTNRLSQFTGNKIPLPDNVTWQIKKVPLDKLTNAFNVLKTKAISVLVVSDDDRNEDIEYLHAVFSLLKKSKLNDLTFEFKNADFKPNLQGKEHVFDWIFYLSSTPVSAYFLQEVQKGTRLIIDAKHQINTDITNIKVENAKHGSYLLESFTVSRVSEPTVNVEQALLDDLISKDKAKVLWQNISLSQKNEDVILEEYVYFSGKILAFYSRFNPKWNELVTQLQFPHVLLSLLLDESIQSYQQQQQLTTKQIKSRLVTSLNVNPNLLLVTDEFKNPFINKLLIFLIVLFWSIERVLSEVNRVKQSTISDKSPNVAFSPEIEKS